jgi:hypothetical protein
MPRQFDPPQGKVLDIGERMGDSLGMHSAAEWAAARDCGRPVEPHGSRFDGP